MGFLDVIRQSVTVNLLTIIRIVTFWLHNVHYLRISNLEIGYSLPTWMLKPIHAQKVRIYGSVSNLCSFDNVHQYGIDPEITAAAAVVYPQQRTFLVGFNVTF